MDNPVEWRTLIENMPDPIARFDRQLRFTFVNRAYCQLTGRQPQDVIGKTNYEIDGGAGYAEEWTNILKQVLLNGKAGEMAAWYLRGDEKGYMVTKVLPELNADGTIQSLIAIGRDMTEQKKAERETLRLRDKIAAHAEDKYKALIDSIDEGFCILEMLYDDTGKLADILCVEANPVYERVTGQSHPVGKRMSEIRPNTDRHWSESYEKVARTGQPMHGENYSSDTQRWYRAHASRIGGEGSRQVAVIFDDITARKRAELNQAFLNEIAKELVALETIETTMALLAERIGIYFGTTRCMFAEASEDMETCTSYGWNAPGTVPIGGTYKMREFLTDEQLENYKLGKLSIVSDTRTDPNVNTDAFSNLGICSFISVPLSRADKWRFQISIIDSKPRQWRDDEIELMTEIANRIWIRLERARAEEGLRKSEEKYRTLFDSIDEGFCIIQMIHDNSGDPIDWRFLQVNRAFELNNGLSSAEGKTIREMVPDIEPKWMKIYDQVSKTGIPLRFEEDSPAFGRIFNLYAFRIGDPAEHKVAVIFTDFTVRRKAEEALKNSEQRLKESLKTRDEFIAIASHELKTPVTSIKVYAELVEDRLGEQNATEDFKLLQKLNTQVDRLTALINDMLDTTKISEGQMKFTFAPIEINTLLKENVAEMSLASGRTIELITDSVPPVVADSERIGQVMANLLSNSVKFSPEASTITVTNKNLGDSIQISVRDRGYGISPADQERIFDRFFRVTSNKMDTFPGMGLGLYISAHIVHQHGGSINVNSKPGEGTTFYFTIPYHNPN